MLKTSFIILYFCFGSLVFAGSKKDADKKDGGHHHHHHMNHKESETKVSTAQLNGQSVYNLDSKWRNRDNQEMALFKLKGQIIVLSMVYTSCAYACPLLVHDMKTIFHKLPKRQRKDVRFVLVSIDPKRDTPQALHGYAKKMKLYKKNWTLLTGSDDTALELAAVLGVKYKRTGNGDFSHSNIISILDSEGVLKHQQTGLDDRSKKTLEVMDRLFKQQAKKNK